MILHNFVFAARTKAQNLVFKHGQTVLFVQIEKYAHL